MWGEAKRRDDPYASRKKRIPLRIPIRISGSGPGDTYFTEKSETQDVSYQGCRFLAHMSLPLGMLVAIRVANDSDGDANTGKRGLFRVIWQKRVAGGFSTGAVQLLPHDVWDLESSKSFRDLATA